MGPTMNKLQLAGSLAIVVFGFTSAVHAQTTTINTAQGTVSGANYDDDGSPNVNITSTGSITYSGANNFTNTNGSPQGDNFFDNIENSGSLTVNSATFQDSANAGYNIDTEQGGTTILTGGSYTSTEYNNIENAGGTTTFSGGTYTSSNGDNIDNASGSTIISGGSFTQNGGGGGNYTNESGSTTISGGTFINNNNDGYDIASGGGTLSISGGDFTTDASQDVIQVFAVGSTITLTNLGDGTTVDLGGGSVYDFDANNGVIDISGPGIFSETGTVTGTGLFTETYGGNVTSYTYNTTNGGSLDINTVPVPEPLPATTLILGGVGIGLLTVRSRRKTV